MKRYSTLIAAMTLSVQGFAAQEWLKDGLNDPIIWMALFVGVFLLFTLGVVNRALNVMKEHSLKAQGRWEEYVEKHGTHEENTLLKSLTAAVPVERESEVMTDHEYDGIRELDNRLPPWWLWGFYISIAFAVVYLIRFHVTGDGQLSHEEFATEMEEAEIQVAAYMEKMGNQVDENNVTLLTDASALAGGKKTFDQLCASCHAQDGGGIAGPNLTDEYWINGGGVQNVFKTVKNGGRPGTAMIAWKDNLSPRAIHEVASYVISLQDVTPAAPKDPEGELWVEEATEEPTESTEAEDAVEEVESTENTEE